MIQHLTRRRILAGAAWFSASMALLGGPESLEAFPERPYASWLEVRLEASLIWWLG